MMATAGLPQSQLSLWSCGVQGGKAFDPRSAWTGHDPERTNAACRTWRSFATLHAVDAWSQSAR